MPAIGQANIRENLFQKRLQDKSIIGWNKGGRSWQVADIIQFNQWLQEITLNKKQQHILKSWGIAHDCFDSVIALHFIYALKKGLALKYGKINSITYTPMKFIQLALKKYGTINAHQITYEVDLWKIQNYQPGLIYLSPGEPGHAYYLSHFTPDFYAYKLEGPFPAHFAQLKVALFTELNVGKSSFRRFPLYIKRGNTITSVVPKAFPQSKHRSWWRCVGEDSYYKRPLWENVKNFMSYYHHRITFYKASHCKHNVYWNKNHVLNPPKRPNYQKAVFLLTTELCRLLKERVTRVNRGYQNCYEPLLINEKKCTSHPKGIYSTPHFDQRIGDLTNNIANLVKHYGISQIKTLKNIKCGPFNLHQKTATPPLFVKIPIYQTVHTNRVTFKKWLQNLSHDPQKPLTNRWGCKSYDIEYKCLEPVIYDSIKAEEDTDYKNIVNYDYSLRFLENKVILKFKAHLQGKAKKAIKSIRFSFIQQDTPFIFDFQQGKITLILDITPFREETEIEFIDEYGETLFEFILDLPRK